MKTNISLSENLTQKDIANLRKLHVPKAAKSIRITYAGKKGGKIMDHKDFEMHAGVACSVEFSASPVSKPADFKPLELKEVATVADKATGKTKVVAKAKAEKKAKEVKERVDTGYMKLIDELLLSKKYTIGAAHQLVMEAFPKKDADSVRRIVSNRPHMRRRRGLDDVRWVPSAQGTGFMKLIDELSTKGGLTFKDIIAKLLSTFPDKEEHSVVRIVRNRMRKLRRKGVIVNFIKVVQTKKEKPAKTAKAKAPAKPVSKGKAKKAAKKAKRVAKGEAAKAASEENQA